MGPWGQSPCRKGSHPSPSQHWEDGGGAGDRALLWPGQSRLPLRPRGPHRGTSTLVHPGSDCRHRFLAKRPHVKVLASRLDAPSRPCCLLALQFSKCGRCHEPRENSEAPPAGATRRGHDGFPSPRAHPHHGRRQQQTHSLQWLLR